MNDVKEQGLKASNEIVKLQGQASNLNEYLTSIKQDSDSFIDNKSEELKALTLNIGTMHVESTKSLERISNLLQDVETKNKQYQRSIETMSSQMKQLEALTNMLKEILTEKGKEASNE